MTGPSPCVRTLTDESSTPWCDSADAISAEGRKADAVDALGRAITLEPLGQLHLSQSDDSLYAELGRRNEIQRVYRQVEAALAQDLDAEPEEEAVQLRKRLLDELSHRSPTQETAASHKT